MWAAGHANDVPEEESRALVAMLIERGARLDEADDRGKTSLMIAAEAGHAVVVQELIKHGAAWDVKDKDGKTAADLALNDAVKSALGIP
jgi:ankyrin repeat protein